MEYIEKILEKCQHIQDSREKRIWLFKFVRDILYSTAGSHEPEDVINNGTGNCAAKAKLLGLLLNRLGYESRMILVKYKLRDFPSEVRFIPEQTDYHHTLEVKVNGRWIIVDPTYDLPLKNHGFQVNEWDGENATKLAEQPLAIKRENEINEEFDSEFSVFLRRLEEACNSHEKELAAYTQKFNEHVQSLRK